MDRQPLGQGVEDVASPAWHVTSASPSHHQPLALPEQKSPQAWHWSGWPGGMTWQPQGHPCEEATLPFWQTTRVLPSHHQPLSLPAQKSANAGPEARRTGTARKATTLNGNLRLIVTSRPKTLTPLH
jgi:hypothetical protein